MKILNYDVTKAGTVKGLISKVERLERLEKKMVQQMADRYKKQSLGRISYHTTQGATGYLGEYYPLNKDLRLYRLIREIVSFLDVAIIKLTMYVGDFEIYSDDTKTQELLREWKERGCKTNYFQRGLREWLKQMVESTLALGMGIGEYVDNGSLYGETWLFNGNAEYIRFMPDEENGIALGYQPEGTNRAQKFEDQERVFYTAFDQRDGNPFGYSIFNSLNFVSRIYTRLNESLHNQAWRLGDPVYFSTVMGDGTVEDDPEQELAESISNNIRGQFDAINELKNAGQVGDMHVWGPNGFDIKIQMLGADGSVPIMDFEFPSRMVIEQMTAKMLLPPWDYGLYNWNSNYKMSDAQQAALKGALMDHRSTLNPIIERILNRQAIKFGSSGRKWFIRWNEIEFTDRSERAKAMHLEASAQEKLTNNQLNIWSMGVIDDGELYENLVDLGVVNPETSNKQKVIDNLNSYKVLLLLNPAGNAALGKTKHELLKAILE